MSAPYVYLALDGYSIVFHGSVASYYDNSTFDPTAVRGALSFRPLPVNPSGDMIIDSNDTPVFKSFNLAAQGFSTLSAVLSLGTKIYAFYDSSLNAIYDVSQQPYTLFPMRDYFAARWTPLPAEVVTITTAYLDCNGDLYVVVGSDTYVRIVKAEWEKYTTQQIFPTLAGIVPDSLSPATISTNCASTGMIVFVGNTCSLITAPYGWSGREVNQYGGAQVYDAFPNASLQRCSDGKVCNPYKCDKCGDGVDCPDTDTNVCHPRCLDGALCKPCECCSDGTLCPSMRTDCPPCFKSRYFFLFVGALSVIAIVALFLVFFW